MELTASPGLERSPRTPPVTSTSPVGSTVALRFQRASVSEPVYVHSGLGLLRSTISAVFVGGLAPPTYRIFPGSYITADP